MKSILIVVLCFLAFSDAYQMVPVPITYDGLTIGQKGAPVQIEAFYDLLCPDSKYSNNQINALFSNPSFAQYLPKISFTFHIFPLPYHDYAFSFSQLFREVFNNFNSIVAFNYINFVFSIQDQYTNGQTKTLSRQAVFDLITNQVHDAFPQISKDRINASFTNSTLDKQTRYSWKYGCSRQVAATPTFFLNGVLFDGADEFDSADWQQALLPYLQQSPRNGVDINQFYSQ